jgi:KDO2-lipid IV(A) lauroyltransferase
MKKRPRRFVLYLLLRTLMFLVRLLPRRPALTLGRVLGALAYYVVPRQRKRTLANLRSVFAGEKSECEIKSLARKVFENLAMTSVDVILFTRLNQNTLREWLNYDDEFARVNRLLDEGKGILMITGHVGNWELVAAAFGVMGYHGAVVGRRIYYEKYDSVIVNLREQVRVRTVYRDDSPKEILSVLRANQILGILADQDVDSVEGIFVEFFGRPAYTPTAPVKIALAAETPIVPVFVIREGWQYRLVLEEPIRPRVTGLKEEAIREYTQKWSVVVERHIREHPEQWVWMHDRWKTMSQKEVPAIPFEQEIPSYGGG